MINISLRDPNKLSEFGTPVYQCPSFSTFKYKTVFLVVHGYNTSDAEAHEMGEGLNDYQDKRPFELCIVSWPSDDKWVRYGADRKDAVEAGGRLAILINDLKNAGFRVYVCAHSMGNYVVANCLPLLKQAQIYRWYSMAADISAKECAPDGKWGKHADKTVFGSFYYSRNDRVLGWVSNMINIGNPRLGWKGLPEIHPPNWFDENAEKHFGGKIRHSGYFQIRTLWDEIFDQVARGV